MHATARPLTEHRRPAILRSSLAIEPLLRARLTVACRPAAGRTFRVGRAPNAHPPMGPPFYTKAGRFSPSGSGKFRYTARVDLTIAGWPRNLLGSRFGAVVPGTMLTVRDAPVAQLDRASDYGSEGWRFESSRVYLEDPLLTRGFSLRQGRHGIRTYGAAAGAKASGPGAGTAGGSGRSAGGKAGRNG